jgi:predicted nucleic acid-binding protein
MIVCDTGILVALIRADDDDHERVVELMKTVRAPLITTWPCMTETMYLVGSYTGQETLRNMVETAFLTVHHQDQAHILRAFLLMRQYADAPMDFADASLVVTAEAFGISQILRVC